MTSFLVANFILAVVLVNAFKVSGFDSSDVAADRRILREYFQKQAGAEDLSYDRAGDPSANDVSALFVIQKMLRPRVSDVIPGKRGFNLQGSLLK